jgi:aminotransferase
MREKLSVRARQAGLSGLREMFVRAAAKGCINLGPGICDLKPDAKVLKAAQRALSDRHHCYAPSEGVPALKEAIGAKYAGYNRLSISPDNILVTAGATGGFECICKAFVAPGDEVVLFEPFYQYHLRQIVQHQGVPRYVRLHGPDWKFNEQELRAALSERTKLLVMSNPNNPTGKVFSQTELQQIGSICRDSGVIVVCDEVYEYILDPGSTHISMASLPGMFNHTLTLSSASKTFSVTGWRVGWLIGPASVMGALTVQSDETYLCAPTPLQHAIAECLPFVEYFSHQMRIHYQHKKNELSRALQSAGFCVLPCAGAIYLMAAYDQSQFASDIDAANALIEELGIASVPGNEFFAGLMNSGTLRFCFWVEQDLIDRACERLAGRSSTGHHRDAVINRVAKPRG